MKTLLLTVSVILLAGCASVDTQVPKSEEHAAVRLPNGFVVVTDSDHPPLALQRPDALLPQDAKARGISGEVTAKVTVSPEGLVTSIEIISSPDDSLTKAAKEALQAWVFIPAVQSGRLVSGKIVAKLDFRAK